MSHDCEPKITKIYANHMQAAGGAFDLTLDFGQSGVGEDADPEISVRIAMSWEHAAAMVQILQGLVERYEKDVGQIPRATAETKRGEEP